MEKTRRKITKVGLEALKTRKMAITKKLKIITDQIDELSIGEGTVEDDPYYRLKEERLQVQDSLRDLELLLDNVSVVDCIRCAEVKIGSKVKLANHQICHIFRVVDPVEANAVSGRISSESPLGKSLIGKKAGQHIQVRTPSGAVQFKVAQIT